MRKWFLRILVYIAALLVLALGITLNVKTGLGVSPIISVAHVFSVILSVQICDTTFVLYTVFVLAQMAMHLVMYRRTGACLSPPCWQRMRCNCRCHLSSPG